MCKHKYKHKHKCKTTLALSLGLGLGLLLLLTGCQTTSISTTLSLVSDACTAATVAIPIFEGLGTISTATGNTILSYTSATGTAASQAATELLTTDTPAIKDTKIIADFANIAVPVLGSSGPQVQVLVMAISSAVELFLSQLPVTEVVTAKATLIPPIHNLKLTRKDKRVIGELRGRFTGIVSTAKGLVK